MQSDLSRSSNLVIDASGFSRQPRPEVKKLEPCRCTPKAGPNNTTECCHRGYCKCRKGGFFCGGGCSCRRNNAQCGNDYDHYVESLGLKEPDETIAEGTTDTKKRKLTSECQSAQDMPNHVIDSGFSLSENEDFLDQLDGLFANFD